MLESPTTTPDPVPAWSAGPLVSSPLLPGDRVLVIGAHPDDETIGAGRILAEHDGPVRAVTLTAGEHCLPGSDPIAMGDRRLTEWDLAVSVLGAAAVSSPRWPDGCLAEHEAAVTTSLTEIAADADVLVTTWRHDPHPDHRAAGRAVAAVAAALGARLVEFPVWAPYWTARAEVARAGYSTVRVVTTRSSETARTRALAAYVSQTTAAASGEPPVVPAAMLDRHPHQILMTSVADEGSPR